jgi:hypothetical protein
MPTGNVSLALGFAQEMTQDLARFWARFFGKMGNMGNMR